MKGNDAFGVRHDAAGNPLDARRDTAPRGLASTSKKTAPVRRTALRTSDSTSMAFPRG